jgi:integrase
MDSNVIKMPNEKSIENDNVIDFNTKKKEKKGIEIKYCKRKNDTDPLIPKKTPCNSKENRDNVYPFKETDIPRMISYLEDKIEHSRDKEDEIINRRYKALYIMGINIGLRVSDLLSLKWNEVYDKNWEFLDGKKIAPIKTRNTKKKNPKKKKKHVLLVYNDAFRQALEEYRKYINITNMDSYIFKSREGGHIQPQTVGKVIKSAALALGIRYNVNTHSMRKTFARVYYDHAENKEQALIDIMIVFGHSSIQITKDYLCLTDEAIGRVYNSLNLGFKVIEE